MKIAGILLAAALLAPAALNAQGQPGQRARGRMMMRSAPAIAIEHKADLGLSDQVVAQLQTIEKQLQDKNAPLMQKMQEVRGGADFQSMSEDQRQQMRQIFQQMRQNNDAARADAEKLLTADQVSKLGDIIQQEMPRRGPRNQG